MCQIQSYVKENQAMGKHLFKPNQLHIFLSRQTSFKTEFIIYALMEFFLCTTAVSGADV